jgi:hypothetical protein
MIVPRQNATVGVHPPFQEPEQGAHELTGREPIGLDSENTP